MRVTSDSAEHPVDAGDLAVRLRFNRDVAVELRDIVARGATVFSAGQSVVRNLIREFINPAS